MEDRRCDVDRKEEKDIEKKKKEIKKEKQNTLFLSSEKSRVAGEHAYKFTVSIVCVDPLERMHET